MLLGQERQAILLLLGKRTSSLPNQVNFQEDAGHSPAWLSALQLQPGEEQWAPLPFTAAQAAGWEGGFSSSFSLGPSQSIS